MENQEVSGQEALDLLLQHKKLWKTSNFEDRYCFIKGPRINPETVKEWIETGIIKSIGSCIWEFKELIQEE